MRPSKNPSTFDTCELLNHLSLSIQVATDIGRFPACILIDNSMYTFTNTNLQLYNSSRMRSREWVGAIMQKWLCLIQILFHVFLTYIFHFRNWLYTTVRSHKPSENKDFSKYMTSWQGCSVYCDLQIKQSAYQVQNHYHWHQTLQNWEI